MHLMNSLYWTAGIGSILATILYYYPTVFYVLIFVSYSVILIVVAIFATLYVHHLWTTKCAPLGNHHPSILANALT